MPELNWKTPDIKPTEDDYYLGSVLAICGDTFPCLVSYYEEYDEWQDESCLPKDMIVWAKIIPPEGLFNA